MTESVATYDFLGPPTEAGDLGALAHYRVLDELGKGGMGYVFRALDSKLQRTVALKVMNQKIAATANSRRRFLHEARAMAAVRHDNVATIFEVGESDGTPFMAMEMLKGGTLETFNKEKNRLGYETIIAYAQQIARGLAAAHSQGIVHRDIKPANIWIEEGIDRIKILDFGLALASTPVDHLAGRGAVIGTPGYLSPEQARSEPLDDRSDLYSLGVVLYELCTGQLPLQSGSVSGQLIAILAHRPPPVHELNPQIPRPLCDLIHRLLRKEPKSRPQSASALEQELNRVREECDAKSEVAQAINKLQVGLTEVVSKSDSGSFVAVIDEIPEAIIDPLATIPSAFPVGSTSSGSFPAVSGPKPKPPPPSKANWQLYAPLLAIVVVVVTVLPITAFFFSQAGRKTEAIVTSVEMDYAKQIGIAGTADEAIARRQRQDAERKAKEQEQQPAANAVATPAAVENRAGDEPTTDAAIANEQTESPSARLANTNLADAAAPPNTSAENTPAENTPAENTPAENTPPENPAPPEIPEPDPPSLAPVTPSEPSPVQPPPSEYVWTMISTRDGQGADVSVRKGTSDNLDDKPIISVRTRGEVETEHTYLRFDLSRIEALKQAVQTAELVLVIYGDPQLGGVLRVHGLPDLGVWPQRKLTWKTSFSEAGLESKPLLAELEISAEKIARVGGQNMIRISSPELTKFIVESTQPTVTLVLAGSGVDNNRVEFQSREDTPELAPRLRIHVPTGPPAEQVPQSGDQPVATTSDLSPDAVKPVEKDDTARQSEKEAKKAQRKRLLEEAEAIRRKNNGRARSSD